MGLSESLSVRHLQKNTDKLPKIGSYSKTDTARTNGYDTFEKKCDTPPLRLYKVRNIYYYRQRIDKKLYRVSLKTSNLKTALYRKKLIELLSKEELLRMFSFEHGDYKYIFEYDTPEELEKYIETMTNNIEKIEAIKNRHFIVHKEMDKAEKSPKTSSITWSDLEVKFITAKKKLGKVSTSTYKAYESTFNKLKDYFNKTKIDDITIEDYEEFRDYLMEDLELKKKTVNNHMAYVNMFLEYGVNYKFIEENNVKGIENLKEDDSIKKENFTDEDIKAILSCDYPQNYKDIFVIAAYSGMRVSEIIGLTPESIKKDENDIYYFDIVKSKTKAGIRKVPIHKDILERVLQMNFPLMNEKSDNASQKAILRQLYKVIDKESTKTFHTFRGTFISKCLNAHPEKLLIIQEIVGHSKDKGSLTIDTYAKGFELQLKKEIVDSVAYNV